MGETYPSLGALLGTLRAKLRFAMDQPTMEIGHATVINVAEAYYIGGKETQQTSIRKAT